MRRRALSWFLLPSCVLLSCGDDGTTPPPPDAGLRRETAASLGRDVVLPTLREFATAAAALEAAASAWSASGASAERDAARDAWRAAMDVWQQAEAMQVGPAGPMGTTVGGEDLRDEIYSWPIVNPCRVDQELVEGAYADVDAFAAENVNVRGLDALEYLLFYEGTTNQCSALSAINSDGSWDAIVGELPTRRAAYAATAAALVRRAADDLVGRWEGGFLDALATAGAGSEVFPTAQEALNALSDALFYLDKETKDMKLAEPAGLAPNCMTETCPELRESRWANYSMPNIRNNLRGFRRIFEGSVDGRGFDDMLSDVGAGGVAAQMATLLDAADARAAEVTPDVPTALAADANALLPTYEAIKAVTDLLKTEFVTALDLEVPRRAEGDND